MWVTKNSEASTILIKEFLQVSYIQANIQIQSMFLPYYIFKYMILKDATYVTYKYQGINTL